MVGLILINGTMAITQQNHRQNHIETYSNNDNMQSEVPFYSKSMLLNRLNSLATGSYKYNPYIINQVNRFGNNSISRIKILQAFPKTII